MLSNINRDASFPLFSAGVHDPGKCEGGLAELRRLLLISMYVISTYVRKEMERTAGLPVYVSLRHCACI